MIGMLESITFMEVQEEKQEGAGSSTLEIHLMRDDLGHFYVLFEYN